CTPAATLHAVAGASQRGYADRFAYVADPDHVDIDWQRLVSREYAAERRAEFDRTKASRPGAAPRIGRNASPAMAGDGGCTTHFSIVDSDGTMVAVTQTLTLIF